MHGNFSAASGVAPQHSQFSRFPAEVTALPQWALAGASKAPLSVDADDKLFNTSVTRPSEWLTFEQAVAVAERHREKVTTHVTNEGRSITQTGLNIGFILHEADPFTIIDVDVKDADSHPDRPDLWTTPEQLDFYWNIVQRFDSYTELSRSGKGLHAIVKGKIGRGFRRDGIEIYSQDRFMICTGNTVLEKPIKEQQTLLLNMMTQMRPISQEVDLWGNPCPDYFFADWASRDSGELGELFRGNWQGRYPSQSEADLALVKLILPHVESPRECWETFRLSKLGQRPKAARLDYARGTVGLATQHLASDAEQVRHGRALAEQMGLVTMDRQESAASLPDWAHKPAHFRLLRDDELDGLPVLRWFVKGIIPNAGIGTIYGDSGTYKSFLTLDLLAHISNGQEWFGRKVNAAPAVYVPFEGQGGVPNRVKAWRLAQARLRNPEALMIAAPPVDVVSNVAIILESINLREAADREKLVSTLIERGWAGGVLCIDTLAHASNGIDENSSEMGEMIGIFRDLQLRLGGVILVIHHSGKDQGRGMRGWSGLHAAMDFVVECQRDKSSGDTEAKFVLTKVKDGSDGLSFAFAMQLVALGFDEDGDEITSLTVCPAQSNGKASSPSARSTKKGIKDIDAETAAADDEFIHQWVDAEVVAGNFPSKNSLKGQLPDMKESYDITQDRVGAAIERLIAAERLVIEKEVKSRYGNVWIYPVRNHAPAS